MTAVIEPSTLSEPYERESDSVRSEPYLHIDGVRKDFRMGRESVVAVRDVTLEVRRGEFVAFIGHSGCGKSTVLNMVAGVYPPTAGGITVAGQPVTGPGPDRAMVFQSYSLLPWMNVEENVFQAVDAVFDGQMTQRDKRARTERFLKMVNLWEHRQKRPSEISGGMRQRVAIARAFAVKPDVLLLDEPFGALDALTKGGLHDELLRLWRDNGRRQTILMVTHDIDEAIYLADRVMVMTDGPAATIREVIDIPLERPRDKRSLMHDDRYLEIKEHLLFLLQGDVAVPVSAH
ncbi:MAG: ABC transporter ATP-binding protein [Gemmatimonadaceae bacterium]